MQNDNTNAETLSPLMNRKTSDNPIEMLENYIETVKNDHNDENVYEINPVITWETLKNYRECEKFNVIMDKFEGTRKQRFSPGFWHSKTSQKLYILILRIKLGLYTMESLYKISLNDLKKNYGCGLINKFNGIFYQLVKSIYPECEWSMWRQNQNFAFEYYKQNLMDLFKEKGICVLSYKWLCDNGYKNLYNNIVIGRKGYKTTFESLAEEWGVHNEWKNQRHSSMVKERGNQLWTAETFDKRTNEIIQEYGYVPAAEYLRKNGFGGYVSYMYQNNITMSDLEKKYQFQKNKWVSKNGMHWRSHAECCLANFLYARGIEIKNGERYPDKYAEITGRPYGLYDLHFKSTFNDFQNKWIKVEVWGDTPNGHSEIEYALKRKQKEEFHKNDNLFLGVSYKQCYVEDELQNTLEKYIGIIAPYIFKDERDKLFQTTQWTQADIVMKECKYIMQQNNNVLPSEGWFRLRKGGKYENRNIEDWEKNIKVSLRSLSVYIKQIGGIRKVRKILGSDVLSCFPNSTISAKVPSTNYSILEFVLDVSKDIIKENGCFPPILFLLKQTIYKNREPQNWEKKCCSSKLVRYIKRCGGLEEIKKKIGIEKCNNKGNYEKLTQKYYKR